MMEISDTQKIGVGLTGFGVTFVFLGMLLFFDKGLLAIGNILFIVGVTLAIGVTRTIQFFFQRHKWRGSGLFFGGILVVLMGWAVFGIVIEFIGGFYLFGFMLFRVRSAFHPPSKAIILSLQSTDERSEMGMIPVVLNFIRRVPILSTILNLPGLKQVLDKIAGPESKYPV